MSSPRIKRLSTADDEAAANARGFEIRFDNLRFSVPGKEILRGVSGHCRPGRVLAVMGQSGAGKSTFLDILACNPTPGGKVSGQITVDGAPRRAAAFRRASCYVLQRDVLQASATVRECITTSALLKLPMSMTRAEKEARVDGVLTELGLLDCQHVRIGDELLGIKGVSGGQRRRVSIGIELVKNPTAIFADEPTSGLDSEMAAAIMDTLQALARRNRTVVLTIHQPNSMITSQFDDFLLLASGRSVYFGAWAGAVPFFAAVGLHCPQYTNPTDFFLSVLQDPANEDALVEARRRKEGAEGGDAGALSGAEGGEAGAGGGGEGADAPSKGPLPASLSLRAGGDDSGASAVVPAWYQTAVLSQRYFRNYIRNPGMLFAEFSQYLFIGLFTGLIYLQLNDSIETGVSDRLGAIFLAAAITSFTPSYTAVTIWDRERVLLRRETSQAMYSVHSWFAARTLVTWPILTAQTLIFCFIAFFMIGFAITASNLSIFLAAFVLFELTSENIGVMCATVTRNSTTAILILTFVLLLLLSFSGFLVSSVPVYFKWVTYISYLTYTYSPIAVSEFSEVTFNCTTGPPTCAQAGLLVPGSELVPPNVNNGIAPGWNLLILLGIALGTRLLAYLTILGAARFHFL